MTPAPARLGLWFALTLLLPAAFAAGWVWLVPGGVIVRAEQDERRAAEQALSFAEQTASQALLRAAAAALVLLQLDAERRVVAPFCAIKPSGDDAVATVAEQAAVARLVDGDVPGALPFFAHAAAAGSLTPQGWLRYADAQALSDPAVARALLATASLQFGDARCGPLPFRVLAMLAEARIASASVDESWFDAFVTAMHAVPADAVPVVLEELQAVAPQLDGNRVLMLRATAAAAATHRVIAIDTGQQPGPDGSVLVPVGDDRCAVLPAVTVARVRDDAFAAAAVREPALRIVAVAATDGEPAVSLPVAAMAETWTALPMTTPTSVLLTIAARTSLVLALATLVIGNLLLWRLTRRESQLVRLRADFVDVVSHELRTPLTALSLKVEMLALDDVPAARRAYYLQGLHLDVQRLADQVERILDFGRLQKGAPLRRDVVPARALLAKALRQGRPALRLVEQHLAVDVPRALPAIVGDVEVLSRALRNLFENAAKYAPPGSTVAVRAFAQAHELVVEIADRGPGVPFADRKSIFQPFVRGSAASSATPGSGLGLSLVAAAAASHGGRITVHERPGGGSVFTLHLPVPKEPNGKGAAS